MRLVMDPESRTRIFFLQLSFHFIVIGSVVERIIYQNNKYYLNNYVESYIQTNGNRIRSLSTPGIVRDDEPNDVVIEIFTGEPFIILKSERN